MTKDLERGNVLMKSGAGLKKIRGRRKLQWSPRLTVS